MIAATPAGAWPMVGNMSGGGRRVPGVVVDEGDLLGLRLWRCGDKPMVLSSLKEFVMLLVSERDLVQMLRTKVRVAALDKKQFFEVLA